MVATCKILNFRDFYVCEFFYLKKFRKFTWRYYVNFPISRIFFCNDFPSSLIHNKIIKKYSTNICEFCNMLRRVKNQDIFFRLEKPTFVKRTQILITYKKQEIWEFCNCNFWKIYNYNLRGSSYKRSKTAIIT